MAITVTVIMVTTALLNMVTYVFVIILHRRVLLELFVVWPNGLANNLLLIGDSKL
jgi:hypothetical protein